ncbi:NAD-dependent epimerase/dehydratase family protein [Falsiroseomonas sp. E2-1-a20]|uniref:NAD-dependent epimerase/dehydratase family protein n=1 Tax=Falsiroseomonas sp. E2-1-a20 TaxID=3239300 RepID=UPI003F320917
MNQKPLVAVTGVSGFTGWALATALLAEGHPVRGLIRSAAAPRPAGTEVVVGDLGNTEALKILVDGVDTVFHIAAMFRTEGAREEFFAVNRDGTRRLLEAAEAGGVRRFVYCSTIGVHGDVANSPADENSPFNPRDAYQESKLEAEQVCHEFVARGAMEIVIIRPCSIYGPGDLRMLKMFRMLQNGTFIFVGDGRPNFHPAYIDDLVQGFMLAMNVPEAAGETFIIGNEYLPLRDYVATAAHTVEAAPPKRRIPYGLMHNAAHLCEKVCIPLGLQPPLHRRRLSFFKHNRAFTTRKANRILGYGPTADLEEGFRRTVAWYRRSRLL